MSADGTSEFLSRLCAAAHSFPIEAFDADDHAEAALIFGDMPEMQLIRDLLSLLARTDLVRDLVLGNLATQPAVLAWVTQ
jgi:hypothetical protein